MHIAPAVQAKSEYRRFLFTYLFGGREWSLEVPALSLEEAKERVKVLPFSRCDGELGTRRAANAKPPRKVNWFTRAA